MDKWTELRTAHQVAKLGTVSAAAEALGFHRATVNRHIDVLEEEIGGRIFIRHARGYTLTEIGEDVLRVAQKTEELIDDLAGRIRGVQARIEGEIKLTTLASFARLLMQPIANFKAQNPNCLVTIDANEDLARLEYGEAHIALRAGAKPDHPDYVVRKFGDLRLGLYAHDSYVQAHGMPKGTDDLPNHKFVAPQTRVRQFPFWPWIAKHIQPDMISLSTQNIWVNAEAVSAGLGIGFISDHEAEARGGFHRLLPPNEAWKVSLWLVTHVDLHRTEKVQAMLRCIKSARQNAQNSATT